MTFTRSYGDSDEDAMEEESDENAVTRVTRWVNHEESDEDDDDSKGEVSDKYIRVDQDTSQSSFVCQRIYSLVKIKNKKFTYKSRGLGQAKPEPSRE